MISRSFYINLSHSLSIFLVYYTFSQHEQQINSYRIKLKPSFKSYLISLI